MLLLLKAFPATCYNLQVRNNRKVHQISAVSMHLSSGTIMVKLPTSTSEVQSNRHLHASMQRKWIHRTPNYSCRPSCDRAAACLPTRRVFSTSPQGSLFTKSMPVRGVPVGGNSTEASIIRYSTFSGLLCNRHVRGQARHAAPVRGIHVSRRKNKWMKMRTRWPSCSCIHPQTCPERSPRPFNEKNKNTSTGKVALKAAPLKVSAAHKLDFLYSLYFIELISSSDILPKKGNAG